jgi:hypothetical protein
MIEECGKAAYGGSPLRDDLITVALDSDTTTISTATILHSTRDLAQLTNGLRDLSQKFRKMIEEKPLIPPCDRDNNIQKKGDE